MPTKKTDTFTWSQVEGAAMPYDDVRGAAILECEPVHRVAPDGARVLVAAWIETRDPRRYGDTPEQVRVVSVSLVDNDGSRGSKERAATRFAGTLASGSCYAKIEESTRYDRVETGEPYWRATSYTAWRADGFAADLPEGARAAMVDTMRSAAEHVAEHLPHLFAGGTLKNREQTHRYRLDDLEKARAAERAAKKEVRIAAAAYRAACRRAGVEPLEVQA